ncbi:MAG: polysaccharide deacetylase family protein [Chloroflexi bacterium]|nr:polysaccharide deacetylase family protein [Chloroflexota bacterium]
MQPNPVLKKLGFADSDRLVIIHTDDIGMCHASVEAFADLWEFGLISSGAVMTPCPWFAHTAAYCHAHPGVDMGAHLTLNSEWEGYRWGPLSTRDPGSGLMDAEGYFFRSSEETQAQADSEAVQVELEMQVARCLAAGIHLTHVDTHMGTVAHPRFAAGYLSVALQRRLPAMMLRMDQAGYESLGLTGPMAAFAAQMVMQLEEQGLPLVDQMAWLPLDQPAARIAQAKAMLGSLPPGVTHFVIHPSKDTPELRAITPDWPSRVADYQAFRSKELSAFIRNSGLQVIGYRALQGLMS